MFNRIKSTAWLVPALSVALWGAACEHSPSAPGSLAKIVVVANSETLPIGTSRQFSAVGYDANGNIVGITPKWSSTTTAGTITQAGVFSAGNLVGTFANSVTATVGSLSGNANVTVTAGPPATLDLTPASVTLATGGTQQYTAVFKDAGGNIVTPAATWGVGAGGGAISSTGAFTAGLTAGTFTNTVTVSGGGLSARATVIVLAGPIASLTVSPNPQVMSPGDKQLFVATARDANGNVIPFVPFWTVRAGGGTIDGAGTFTAGAVAGTYINTIRACSSSACALGSITGFATVTVTSGPLASITVTPDPIDVGTNATQQFTAVGRDAGGNVVPITPVWTVQPGNAGGTILSSGGYKAPPAVGVGFDIVQATSGNISGTARVNVKGTSALVAIVVTPNPGSVVTGGTIQFQAVGFDASGVIVATPGLTWAVLAGGGSIDNAGLFTAGANVGSFPNTIRATSGGISGRATVNVMAVPPVPVPNLLGAAASNGILAGSAVTCASAPGTINADVSVWPGLAITGFPPCTLTGGRHAGDPFAQTAQGDLTIAYLALAAMPCGTTITSDLGGTTLSPGVYCSTSSVGVTGTVTLNGPANAVFVIRAPSTLTTAGNVVMSGGASADNVYWWVGSSATLGVGSQWQGNIVALQSITLAGSVTLNGRALARNGAVSLNGIGNTITLP